MRLKRSEKSPKSPSAAVSNSKSILVDLSPVELEIGKHLDDSQRKSPVAEEEAIIHSPPTKKQPICREHTRVVGPGLVRWVLLLAPFSTRELYPVGSDITMSRETQCRPKTSRTRITKYPYAQFDDTELCYLTITVDWRRRMTVTSTRHKVLYWTIVSPKWRVTRVAPRGCLPLWI